MPRATGAAVIAVLIFVELIAVFALFQADLDHVYFNGHPLNTSCSFKQATGLPCPGCGTTRGVVLSVHGHLRDAWTLSPSGPLAAVGAFALGLSLAAYSIFGGPPMVRWIRRGFLTYSVVAVTLWAWGWISTVHRLDSTRSHDVRSVPSREVLSP